MRVVQHVEDPVPHGQNFYRVLTDHLLTDADHRHGRRTLRDDWSSDVHMLSTGSPSWSLKVNVHPRPLTRLSHHCPVPGKRGS